MSGAETGRQATAQLDEMTIESADSGAAALIALKPAAGSTIAFRSAASAGAASGTLSLAINKPAGTVQNDAMVASITVRPSSAAVTPPSGWTLVRRVDNTSGSTNSPLTYVKVAGASEPSSYTWSFSSSYGSAGGIQSFSGVDTTSPVDTHDGQATPSSLSHSTPSITPNMVPNGTPISFFNYSLNAAGNRTQVVDATGTTTYGYDNLHRLSSVTYPGRQTDTYTYDTVGNRLTKNATAYTYDNADQMLTAAGVSYGYDNDGNQTSRGSDSFSWDHEDRMTQAVIGGQNSTYAYNGDGLRTGRTTGGQTSTYVWDIASGIPVILQEISGSNTTTYVYGLGLISTTDNAGAQTYRTTDGLGSTINLTDSSGNVQVTYAYDAFGAIRSQSGSSSNYWLFTGEQRDSESGYDYLRARYYDSSIGRFVSQDPLGGGYAYAGNNPATSFDPLGLYVMCGDSPDWGYVCFNSTDLGLPLCTPDGRCDFLLDDGTIATIENGGVWCDFDFGACMVVAYGDVYYAYSARCFTLIAGGYTCGSYLGNIHYPMVGVRTSGVDSGINPNQPCALFDWNCGGEVCHQGQLGMNCMGRDELSFSQRAGQVFCAANRSVLGCGYGGTDPIPLYRPPDLRVFHEGPIPCDDIRCLPPYPSFD